MFGLNSAEIIILAFLALIFIGPKELPRVMVAVGRFLGKMRGYARHFTDGIEHAMREAELEEMEKEWNRQNERVLAEHPADGDYPDPPHPDEIVSDEPDKAIDPTGEPVMKPFDILPKEEEAALDAEPSLKRVREAEEANAPEPSEAPSVPMAEWEEEPPLPFDVPPAPDDDPRDPSERELP